MHRHSAIPTLQQHQDLHNILNKHAGNTRATINELAEYTCTHTPFDGYMVFMDVKSDLRDLDAPITFDYAWNTLAQALVPVGYIPLK